MMVIYSYVKKLKYLTYPYNLLWRDYSFYKDLKMPVASVDSLKI